MFDIRCLVLDLADDISEKVVLDELVRFLDAATLKEFYETISRHVAAGDL